MDLRDLEDVQSSNMEALPVLLHSGCSVLMWEVFSEGRLPYENRSNVDVVDSTKKKVSKLVHNLPLILFRLILSLLSVYRAAQA
ncbi:Tyrosine-protein kinase TXK [Liparis tanakae]|uniref:Tyrosine-protein kinase TXK n=1 Tax=Liparis tanakae TaxID=230148 RepID=A0A4Z2GGN7_9TELE|nr:Tyrosine-protein kinase TXK [Liparis tanakae]